MAKRVYRVARSSSDRVIFIILIIAIIVYTVVGIKTHSGDIIINNPQAPTTGAPNSPSQTRQPPRMPIPGPESHVQPRNPVGGTSSNPSTVPSPQKPPGPINNMPSPTPRPTDTTIINTCKIVSILPCIEITDKEN